MLCAANQKEKMGECLLYTSLLGIDARDPAAQNSSVDKFVSRKDLESAIKGILLLKLIQYRIDATVDCVRLT